MSQAAHRPVEPGDIVVLDADGLRRALTRLAHEIVERNGTGADLVLAGIPTRGLPLAGRLAECLAQLGEAVEVVELDIARHRDDRDPAPARPASIAGIEVAARIVVLVDDVIFHGRTARAALDALTELGRPAAVQLAVMVDRGHRELPIRADYVGKNIPTHLQDRVMVELEEVDGVDRVRLQEGERG